MTKDNIIERVFDALATAFDVERRELTLDTDLRDDLEADSLDLTALAIELENVFEGDVKSSETDGFYKVRDIVTFIEERVEAYRT
jgi:acyl carrier protein